MVGGGGSGAGVTAGADTGTRTAAAGGAGRIGPVGRVICMMGTFTTGNFGLLDFTLNWTCCPGETKNPSGNVSIAAKDLPGCSSLIVAATPGTLTAGSDNVTRFVLLF